MQTRAPPSIHLKQHSIGRAALIVSGFDLNLAGKMCMPNNCVQAYYHAIAEGWAEYAPSKVAEYMDFLNSNSFCRLEDSGGFNCGHNAGHFYQSVNKSFKENLALCNDLRDYEPFRACATGIIHERFIQSGAENFFELCNFTDRRKAICYMHGSMIYTGWLSGKNPVEVCHGLNGKIPNEFNRCYNRAASPLKDKGITPNPGLCKDLDYAYKELCIKGMSSPMRTSKVQTEFIIQRCGSQKCSVFS